MDFYNDSKNFGDIPGMTLSQEEKTAYPILFNKAEPTNGSISANQAFNFLSKSKLPFDILKKIWQLTQNNSTLNREGFYKALKYVALAQTNQPINPNLLYANTPLPNFEGIYLNSRPNASSGQDVNSLAISDLEYEKWSGLFYQSNPINNNISGNTAKDIFLKSGLSTSILAEVWQLVDLEKTGELDLNEFLIAMYIIMRIRDNTIREVPRAIPQNLWKSVAYNKKAPNFRAQRLSSISSNNENSFSNNFNSSVSLNRTGGSTLPVNINVTGNGVPLNVTGGSIPMNMTGGSININKTGGSSVSINKTGGSIIGRNATLMPSGTQGYNNYNSNIGTNQLSNQSLNAGYSNEYAITPQEREKYDQLFNSIDIMGNQYVTGEQSMEFFLKSQLSTQDLAQIWELADISKAGRLTREEFYIAMHLIRQKKSGLKLPLTLPAVLVPPSLRRMSVNSINNGISASNPQLNQINNTFNTASKGVSDSNLLTSFESTSNKFGSTSSNNALGFDSLRSPSNNMENEVNKLKTEIQQMDNNIISMTNEKQLMKGQRDQLEKELTSLVSKKNDLSMKQTQLKISYDSESKMLNDLRATFAKENQAREASQAECNQLEELVKNLKNEKMFIEHDIERCREEVTQLNNRIKELNTEYSTLKEEVDRLTSEQKHQIDMLNVTRQMTMAEQQKVEQLKQDKMNLQKSIQNNQKEIDRVASERNVPIKQDSKTVNPFEVDGENDFFNNPPSSKSKSKQSFDDAFDALSAHATTFNNDNKFEASFDDAFSAPNTASAQPTGSFDDAFQVQSAKSAQPTSNANIFDDAFQVDNGDNGNNANVNEPEDPFEKHAQSIPNAFEDPFEKNASGFDDAFNNSKITTEEKQNAFANSFKADKNNSALEDPFASNVNLSAVGTATSGFDDAFAVSNDGKQPTPNTNINSFDDAFAVPNNDKQSTPNANINSFDDAFGSNTNSPFTNTNGFDDAFQTNNNNNGNNQSGQVDFGADFNSAFDNNNNNNNDPFKVSENPPTASIKSPNSASANEKQDLAGFAFNQPGFTNQDKAGFSFDNAFDAAAAAATTNVIQSNNAQVASPEIAEAPIKANGDEENDSSVGEEDENIDDNDSDDDDDEEEAENPFGDDQVIEDGFEEEISQTYPMPQPVQNSEVKPVSTSVNEYEPQANVVPGTPEVPMPQPFSEPLQFNKEPVVPEQQEQQQPIEIDQSSYPMPLPIQDQQSSAPVSAVEPPQEQQPSAPVSAVEPPQEQQPSAPVSAVEPPQEQQQPSAPVSAVEPPQEQDQQQPTAPVSAVEPPQEQDQQQPTAPVSAVEQPPQEQQQPTVPVSAVEPPQEQIQSQPQEQQGAPVNSENPFESEGNTFANENAFETDFNNAFENMSISKENQTPGNDTNNETGGNMVKSFSNNSIKIDNFDFDKEFQEFDNNPSGFDKVDTSKNATSDQNDTNEAFDENGVNSSFDEEFKQGFDENDFNFDTTFNNTSKGNTNNSNAFDAFAEQATSSAQFETTFDDGFNNSFNEQTSTTAPNFDTKFDDAFNSTFSNDQSNVSTAHFNTNFDDAFNFDGFSNANNNIEQKPSEAFMDEAFGGSTPALASGDNTNAFDNSAFDNNFNDLNGGDPFAAFSSTTPATNAPTTPATNTEPTNDNTNNANNANTNEQ